MVTCRVKATYNPPTLPGRLPREPFSTPHSGVTCAHSACPVECSLQKRQALRTGSGPSRFLIANRILEPNLTHSKQTTGIRSNREWKRLFRFRAKNQAVELACFAARLFSIRSALLLRWRLLDLWHCRKAIPVLCRHRNGVVGLEKCCLSFDVLVLFVEDHSFNLFGKLFHFSWVVGSFVPL